MLVSERVLLNISFSLRPRERNKTHRQWSNSKVALSLFVKKLSGGSGMVVGKILCFAFFCGAL